MNHLSADFRVEKPADLAFVARQLTPWFTGRDILLLTGPMGVGKTEFVRWLVNELSGESISSPSFAIHNNYETGAASVDHLDLFRIEGEDDLESTGFWDLFQQESGLIILEWADKLDQKLLPHGWQKITIDFKFGDDGNARYISAKS